jgi:hypothetical protein
MTELREFLALRLNLCLGERYEDPTTGAMGVLVAVEVDAWSRVQGILEWYDTGCGIIRHAFLAERLRPFSPEDWAGPEDGDGSRENPIAEEGLN